MNCTYLSTLYVGLVLAFSSAILVLGNTARTQTEVLVEILIIMAEGVLTELAFEMEMEMLHAQAEAHALLHPTPTVEEELEWANTELLTGTLGKSMWENGYVQAFDSCKVDLDGCCEHGYKSPLILLGVI